MSQCHNAAAIEWSRSNEAASNPACLFSALSPVQTAGLGPELLLFESEPLAVAVAAAASTNPNHNQYKTHPSMIVSTNSVSVWRTLA